MTLHFGTRIATVFALSISLAGCGNHSSAIPSSNGIALATMHRAQPTFSVSEPTQNIYVAATALKAILAFPIGANGNVAPSLTISGPRTRLNHPISLAFSPGGHLDVVNDLGSEVLIFPANASGDAAPKILGGSNVPIRNAGGVAVATSGEIFVSGFVDNAIWVFKKGASGNVAPIRTISGPETGLSRPAGMAFDSGGHLYVTNTENGRNAILKFASDANGNVPPLSTLGGSQTFLIQPFNVSIGSRNRIIAANRGGYAVEIFAAGSHGNVAPEARISGKRTTLTYVTSTGVDSSGNIYVANYHQNMGADSILVFKKNSNGNVVPISDITGSNTQLDEPFSPTVH